MKSCLDLVMLSRNLVPYVLSVLMDSKREYAPCRVRNRKGKLGLSVSSQEAGKQSPSVSSQEAGKQGPSVFSQEARKKGPLDMILSDHYTEAGQSPKRRMMHKKESHWNLKKPEGWNKYETMPEEIKETSDIMIENRAMNIEEVMKKMDKLQENVK